mgnify:CR=1 FL=1
MKFSEVFERSGITHDDKARRVLNTSTRNADITASEIEDGVTLERLAAIGVPVFRYATQVTIHGILPGFSIDARPAGFKSVFKNANGTIGVKYVAIDAQKKELLVSASRMGNKTFSARIDSTGLAIYRTFIDKAECIAAYKAIPHHLFYGSIAAGASPLGGYIIYGTIGAIPEANVWPLITALTGIASKEQLDGMVDAQEKEYAERRAQAEKDAAERAKRNDERFQVLLASVKAKPLTALEKLPSDFIRASNGVLGPKLVRYTFKKAGPSICYAVADVSKGEVPVFGKFSRFDQVKRDHITAAISKGLVFEAA